MQIQKIFKTISIALIALVGLTVVVGGALYFEDPLFWKRYILIAKNKGTVPQSGWAGSEYAVAGNHQRFFKVADPRPSHFSADLLNEITTYAEEHHSSSLLIWQDGQLILREHFGDYDAESLIVGKSMAKMIASIVVGRAIKENYIESLDQPAADFITEWQGTKREQISIRHMLHMAAGFEEFYTLDMSPFSNFTRSYLSGHNEDILIDGYELINEPGTQYDYSQVVSDLLALLVERATGKAYGQFLSEALIKPIGAQGGEVMMNRPDGLAHAGCCLLLPSESWLRVGILLLNNGVVDGKSLFPDGWMKDYLAPSPANPAMGLHIWLAEPYLERRAWTEVGPPKGFGVWHSEPYLDPDLFLFDGSGNQVMYIIPSENMVILRTGKFSFRVKPEWDNAYLPNTLIRASRSQSK